VSNRLVAAVIFLVAAAYLYTAQGYSATFGDVLGPSVFPILVAIPTLIFSALIVAFPGGGVSWPERHRIARQVTALLVLIGYALLLQPLGFPLATGLLVALMAWLMGGPAGSSIVLGAISAPGLYLLFDRILGLPLDMLGSWFGGA